MQTRPPARTDVPLCLKHAREEVLMALGAPTAEEEGQHRKRATRYLTKAVRVIQHDPGRIYDWSGLRQHMHH
ncbi:MAG: hypothetical protein PHE36_10960 [Novosphingobium sp.]|nr:hypothetical protein [Novosphingobium sp.]